MKRLLVIAAALITASCATSNDEAVQKSLSNINEELVVVQKSITDMQMSVEDLQASSARGGADISANTDAIAELRSELAYLNNEIMVMKSGSSKNAMSPINDEPQIIGGLDPVIEINVPKPAKNNDQQIIIIEEPTNAPASKNTTYSHAIDLTNQGKYAEARMKFEEFLKAYPKDPLAGNAQYWIGETYYSLNDMNKAVQAFQAVLDKYPRSSKVPDAMLKIGYAYDRLGDRAKAVDTLRNLLNKYPKARSAKLASDKLQSWGA